MMSIKSTIAGMTRVATSLRHLAGLDRSEPTAPGMAVKNPVVC